MFFAVPNSQKSDQTFNATLTKLIEVDSELAVQEAELLSQLESAQEKRRSLKTVINLFTEADAPANALNGKIAQESPAESAKEPEPISEDLVAPALETSREPAIAELETAAAPALEASKEPAIAELETAAASNVQSKGAKRKSLPSIKRNKSAKDTHPAKAAKKTSGWQDYVREEFSSASLSEAVSSVLQRQADAVWEIPAIIDTIFVEELPQDIGNRARRRVTNILSEGARKKEWYRGQLGYYSMSRAAVETGASESRTA